MKPSFALNFTDDFVGLLHRTSQGWLEVGAVPFDEPDLAQALAYLRGSALGLEPQGITTKLVIPNSQIRYMTLPAPGPDAASRRTQIKVALEGKTPYAVEDLVFDWSGTGAKVQVAVVARETLDEAEAFARDNRLNPVAFVAIPEPGDFGPEPWFGPTALAPTILAPGEKVERDQDPIRIVGRLPKTDPTAPAAAPDDKSAEPAAKASPPQPEQKPGAKDAALPEVTPDAPKSGPPKSAPPASDTPASGARKPDAPTPEAAAAAPAEPARPSVTAQAIPEDESRKPAAATAAVAAKPQTATAATPTPSTAPAQAADAAERKPAPPVTPPPAPRAPAKAPDPRRPAAGPAPRLAAVAGGGQARPAKIAPPTEWPLERVGAARGGKAEAARSNAPLVTAPGIPLPRDRKLTVVASAEPTEAARPSALDLPEAEAMTVFGARKSRQRGKPRFLGLILTVILIAILAAVGIWSSIFLAARDDAAPAASVAANETPAIETAEPAPADLPETAANSPAEVPAETDPALASGDTAAVGETAVAPDAASAGPAITAAEAASDAAAAEESAAMAAEVAAAAVPPPPEPAPVDPASLVTPGTAAPARSNGDEPQDEIFLSRVDPPIATSDAVALASPAVPTDPLPGSQPLPPPFGTLYQFDARGLIIPTPEGIVTPEGVRLVAGKPPLVPPARPAAASAPDASAEQPSAAPSSTAAIEAAEPAFADPALAGARPRLRPADPDPVPAPVTTEDDASLSLAENSRFSSLKPRARPPEILAQGEAALAAEASAAAQSAAASLVAGLDTTGASPLAVAVSRKPAARPPVLDQSIEAAVKLAAAEASLAPDAAPLLAAPAAEPAPPPKALAPEPPPKLAAAPAPAPPKAPRGASDPGVSTFTKDDPETVEHDEPEIAASGSSGPTRSVVAKQATLANAINLSKTNLIGVFGSPSNRYALVRQPGGRMVKVAVGDRVDGGRVAAISERELTYIKNGQNVTLKMPKG